MIISLVPPSCRNRRGHSGRWPAPKRWHAGGLDNVDHLVGAAVSAAKARDDHAVAPSDVLPRGPTNAGKQARKPPCPPPKKTTHKTNAPPRPTYLRLSSPSARSLCSMCSAGNADSCRLLWSEHLNDRLHHRLHRLRVHHRRRSDRPARRAPSRLLPLEHGRL